MRDGPHTPELTKARVKRAARRQPVQAGRLQVGMAVAAEVVGPQLIGHDEQHILDGAHVCPCPYCVAVKPDARTTGSHCLR